MEALKRFYRLADRVLVGMFVMFLVVILIDFEDKGPPAPEVPYSVLVNHIRGGNAGHVTVTPDTVTVQFNFFYMWEHEQGPVSARLMPGENQHSLHELLDREVTAKNITVSTVPIRKSWINRQWYNLSILTLCLLVMGFKYRRDSKQERAQEAKLINKPPKTTFGDIGGYEEVKDSLGEIIEFLHNPQRFKHIGARIPRGVLLTGPTGTGKTQFARAIAGQANVPFFARSGSDFVGRYVGEGTVNIRNFFDSVRSSAPCIVFIDEIDAIGMKRAGDMHSVAKDQTSSLTTLLNEMDGFDTAHGPPVIVIAATNYPDSLDNALLRPGRFDRHIELSLPTLTDRTAIIEITLKTRKYTDLNINEIAKLTTGFSGADIENLINEAALTAMRDKRTAISQQDILESVETILLGLERVNPLQSPALRRRIATHEAGHALIAVAAGLGESIQKVSIIARSRGLGGYNFIIPPDSGLPTESQILTRLCVLVAGREAEKLLLNEYSLGSGNDLKEVETLLSEMIDEGGINALGRYTDRSRYISNDRAHGLEGEKSALVAATYAKVRATLKLHVGILTQLTDALIEKEVLNKDEVCTLVGAISLVSPQS